MLAYIFWIAAPPHTPGLSSALTGSCPSPQKIPWKLPRTPDRSSQFSSLKLNVQIGLSLLRPPSWLPQIGLPLWKPKSWLSTPGPHRPQLDFPSWTSNKDVHLLYPASLGYKTDMTCVNIYSVTINSAQYAKSPRTFHSSHILIQQQHNRIFTDRVQNTNCYPRCCFNHHNKPNCYIWWYWELTQFLFQSLSRLWHLCTWLGLALGVRT